MWLRPAPDPVRLPGKGDRGDIFQFIEVLLGWFAPVGNRHRFTAVNSRAGVTPPGSSAGG
jgi:hypothetical protein